MASIAKDDAAAAAPMTAAQKYAERKAAQEELKAQKELEARMAAMDISQFTVYDDDACFGKEAPSLDTLEFVHKDKAGYKEGGGSLESLLKLIVCSFMLWAGDFRRHTAQVTAATSTFLFISVGVSTVLYIT